MIKKDTKFLDKYFDDFKELININLWINSKAYNYIENIHQFWLLSLVDLVIGKKNYLPK